jgi:hypothetical protein
MIKALRKLGVEGLYLNIIKVKYVIIYDKLITNITHNGEKNEPISPKVRNKTRVSTLPYPIQHYSGILSQSNKARRNKSNTNR